MYCLWSVFIDDRGMKGIFIPFLHLLPFVNQETRTQKKI
ncbi:hypothetical protein RV18_GL000149 [Enterococcus termitis]|nr:hypothetical protein RV18_GL000149 [Enterococcus termitis]